MSDKHWFVPVISNDMFAFLLRELTLTKTIILAFSCFTLMLRENASTKSTICRFII